VALILVLLCRYPIMTFMDVVDTTLQIDGGHWGHFHEIG
jgi:hypothetical protein